MRKRTIIISVLCLSLSLPVGVLAETNGAQIPQSIKVESKVTAAVDSTSIVTVADDFFGPVLESATVSPASVGVGDTITITAQVSDESGVAAVVAYLNLPNGNGYKKLPLELDAESGAWKGTYTITNLDQQGTWIIDFDLLDAVGNYTFGDDNDTLQVNNPNGGDSVAPTLEEVVVSPLAVGVDEEVSIRAKVNDNNAVDSVYAAVYTADSTGYYYLPLTLDETNGEWVVSHYFSENDKSGPWYIDIQMFDTAGNFDWVVLEEELVLTNPFSDFTDPTIGAPNITPKSASPGESVKLSVPVSDSQSGVSSVYAEFSQIDSPSEVYLRHLTLDQASGEWVVDFNIGSGFQSGVWNVVIHSTDMAGNSGFKEYPAAFDVINNEGDFDAPIISNVQVTPQGDVQIGDTVTVTANVSDNVGVDSVRATFYSQEGSQFVEMSYDAAKDQWTGNLLVQETTAPGFYSASISAFDTSFNLAFVDAEGGFTVVNPEGDYTGPVISAVELDKTEVNAGEQVTISATVEDSESGVASVTANYYENESVTLTYDSTLNKWVGTITVPTNVPDGEVIKINFIDAVDIKENQTVQFIDAVSFLVHNPDGDFTAPVVESFAMSPTTVKPGETVHFEAKLVDDKSGMKSATAYLYNGTDPNVTSIVLTSGANDVWTADYVIPANSGLGAYSVSLDFEDNAGNRVNATISEKLTVVEPSVESAKYDEALWYYQNNNLYNAVYFAGAAINEGDRRPEVQELMNDAAQALLDEAVSGVNAENAYNLLISTTGVPAAIKEAAQAKLTPEVNSPNYLEAAWYYDNKNYYNAVHFAGAAIAEGDTSAKVQELLNSAAQALVAAAPGKSSGEAQNDYNLLISTTGVPTAIKEEATTKLSSEVKYAEANWYYENSNNYNAVYFAGAAIEEGNARPEVQELLNNAAQALLNAAPSKNSGEAQNDYNLLISTTGVPTVIIEAASAKLSSEVKYAEAAWYYENSNNYNAVYFAGAAITEGNARQEVQDLMNSAAQALFNAAATKTGAEALNDYWLLVNTNGVPGDIKAAAQAKLPQ
ncbi:Ig-like domain repeat protein [Neobacillus niacini]|uniref:Ig-like domain repeat protein n=1 Tax=Neobacillus niacini TaxID=86668 RepID=UPI0005EF3D4E|nr:Ig-like domain repeat protein [Neobacillus niacini]